jgi:hypothetical protein
MRSSLLRRAHLATARLSSFEGEWLRCIRVLASVATILNHSLTMILPFVLFDSINSWASRISSNEKTAAGFAL